MKLEAYLITSFKLIFLLCRLEVSLFFCMQSRGSMIFFGKRKDVTFLKLKLRYKYSVTNFVSI